LNTKDYTAYFEAIKQLRAEGMDAAIGHSSTEMASGMDDAYYAIPYYDTLFERSSSEVRPETQQLYANVTAYGDMNEDGTVDISDAVMLARFAAEDSEVRISRAAVSHADFDGDGNVTGSDVIVILRY
ncbi:dockerin type I repeat-containing protein, partial [Vibrio sp. FNV 38]|nr:dockerin type I repeat-containing protein [Vibrio sp. FNV 38]